MTRDSMHARDSVKISDKQMALSAKAIADILREELPNATPAQLGAAVNKLRKAQHETGKASTSHDAWKPPRNEFGNFSTPLGAFKSFVWEHFKDLLADYRRGDIEKTTDRPSRTTASTVSHKDMIQALNAYLETPGVRAEMRRERNVYQVEERFLRPYGYSSRDDVYSHMHYNLPAYVEVEQAPAANPVYKAVKQIIDSADNATKYRSLLAQIEKDPLTLLILLKALKNDGQYGSPKLNAIEKEFAKDVFKVFEAEGYLKALSGSFGHRDNEGSLQALYRELEVKGYVNNAMEALQDSYGSRDQRIAYAFRGLSIRRLPT